MRLMRHLSKCYQSSNVTNHRAKTERRTYCRGRKQWARRCVRTRFATVRAFAMLPGAESIREPQTSEIIGVLDVTGDNRLVRPHLVTVLIERGLEIEERLALER